MKKIAVVLFNLGGPDSPEAVKPFLLNLFNDPAIIQLPAPWRPIVARLIAAKREKIAAAIYTKIGGRSPILENTKAQAAALKEKLASNGEFRCFVSMRYWRPFAEETAQAVKDFAPDEIVLLPLYPQFSTTTTASSFKSWVEAARSIGLDVPTKKICCYPGDAGFIRSLAQSTRAIYEKAKPYGKPRLLFSAHGLPEKIVKNGDPYQFQCEYTVTALVKELSIPSLDWVLCYQSRVGPLTWIGPSTDEEIIRAGRDKVPATIVPIGFVSEHSETLFEIDILYRELAARSGVPYFDRVATVGTADAFIEGLAELVQRTLGEAGNESSRVRLCPSGFSGCYQRKQTHAP
jgi:ferrochelatase